MKFIKRTDRRLTLILSVIRLSIIPCIIMYFIIGNFADTVRLHKSLDLYNDSIVTVLDCYDAYCESGDGGNYEKLVDSFTESMYIFSAHCSNRIEYGGEIDLAFRNIHRDMTEDTTVHKAYIHDLCSELKTINTALSEFFGRTKTFTIFHPILSLYYRLHTY